MPKNLISPKEKLYFSMAVLVGITGYVILVVSLVGIPIFIYIAIVMFFAQGLFLGYIKGNAVKIQERQLPQTHKRIVELSNGMGIAKTPDAYLLQSGGLLNAFATRFLGRDFVVIYSEILEMAIEKGEPAVDFVLAHELAHIKRNHTRYIWLTWPAYIIPFLGQALSRAREYTADNYGIHYVPEGAIDGMLVLASGKMLFKYVNHAEFMNQKETEGGFFVWLSEMLSSHPNLVKRVSNANERIQNTRSQRTIKTSAMKEHQGEYKETFI